jgi:hypothetical protein
MTNNGNWTDERLDQLAAIVESNARAIQANSESINVVAQAIGRTVRTVEILSQAVEEDRVNFQEYRQRNDTTVASLNAAVERLETIVAYLVRSDKNQN